MKENKGEIKSLDCYWEAKKEKWPTKCEGDWWLWLRAVLVDCSGVWTREKEVGIF